MIAILSALFLQAAAAPGAGIADTGRDQDLRCLVAITAILPGIPPAEQAGVQALAMYYVGRIDARDPRFDYEQAMGDLVDRVGMDALRGDMTRCGTQMQARGRALSALGDALARRQDGRAGKGK